MSIKKLNEFLNESHESGKQDQADFICEVLNDPELLEVFTAKDIKHLYDYVEDVLKKHDLYEDGKGLTK